MIKREELLRSKEYWLAIFQTTLYNEVEKYLSEKNINKTKFAKDLGVSKGYVSQILNGDFDHKISKFIELALSINKVPILKLEDLNNYILIDKEKKLEITTEKYKVNYEFKLDKKLYYTRNLKSKFSNPYNVNKGRTLMGRLGKEVFKKQELTAKLT